MVLGACGAGPRPAAEDEPPSSEASADLDGDGLLHGEDLCPCTAEDADRYEDEDGCPDLDDDGDEIPDACDRCPAVSGPYTGREDEAGCPPHHVIAAPVLVDWRTWCSAPEWPRVCGEGPFERPPQEQPAPAP
jgi:hypothetical protein